MTACACADRSAGAARMAIANRARCTILAAAMTSPFAGARYRRMMLPQWKPGFDWALSEQAVIGFDYHGGFGSSVSDHGLQARVSLRF